MGADLSTLRIALVAPITAHAITGPRNSVTKLALALNQRPQCSAQVFSTRSDGPFSFNDTQVSPVAAASWQAFDCVVLSGVWLPEYIRLAKTLTQLQIPYVISPRSSLMYSQFKHSWHKKLAFLAGGGWRLLQRARAMHFLTADELQHSALASKGFVSSNMLDPASLQKAARVVEAESTLRMDAQQPSLERTSEHESNSQMKIFGFLGRYTIAHKGLDYLVDAVALVANDMREAGWVVQLRGSDNRHERSTLAAQIAAHQLDDIIELGDALAGTATSEFLQRVDVFVHTSRYEGQPQAVMEAMAHGCAVLVTPGANMTQAVTEGDFGYLAELSAKSIAEQLRACMADATRVTRYQNNAAAYAMKHYDAATVAAEFEQALRKRLAPFTKF